MKKIYFLLAITTIISLGSLFYGFTLTGSPLKARDMKFDQRRVQDIADIQYRIETYFSQNQKLPDTLKDLPEDTQYYHIIDPETKEPYEYSKKGDSEYTLCATYKTEEKATETTYSTLSNKPHGKGRVCNDIKVANYWSQGGSSNAGADCSGNYCAMCSQNDCGSGKKSGGGCMWDTSNNYCVEQNAGASKGEACYQDFQCKSNNCQGDVCIDKTATTSPSATINPSQGHAL